LTVTAQAAKNDEIIKGSRAVTKMIIYLKRNAYGRNGRI
jgi:hypothetical protein